MLATLEERVQRLEDVEAIQRLKIRYAQILDRCKSADDFKKFAGEYADLFTEDAVIDAGELGVVEGKKAIADFFTRIPQTLTFFVHYMIGPVIDVAPSGKEATGSWYLWEPATMNGRAVWLAITYDDRYRKVDGSWKIAYSKLNWHFATPYESGWVKERMISS